jgi:phage repressor protein C with HTH and peptisase S24 domain
MDKSTERFVRSRIESMPMAVEAEEEAQEAPFRRLRIEEVQPFENCVPLYELDIAAGRFGAETAVNEVAQDEEIQQPQDFEWVELPPAFHSQRGLFVARVVGNSMNRRIPNGSWCLFRLSPEGSRRGRVVVARLEDRLDPETGRYTVKVYDSEKETLDDGSFRHRRIVLRPDSLTSGWRRRKSAERFRTASPMISRLRSTAS